MISRGQISFDQPNRPTPIPLTDTDSGDNKGLDQLFSKVFKAPQKVSDDVDQNTPLPNNGANQQSRDQVDEEIQTKITETIAEHPEATPEVHPAVPKSSGHYVFKEDKTPDAEAHREMEKEGIKYVEQQRMKVQGVVHANNIILCKIRTHFPLDPFPNEIAVDVSKVTFTFRQFFGSKQVHTAMISDVSDVIVETSPLFSTVEVVDKAFTENVVKMKFLLKNDAVKVRRMVFGIKVAKDQGMDLNVIPPEELPATLEELGRTTEVI